MENKGLIFIPDISGFSKFVSEMEINHSRLIIQELLETLIDSNDIGLELSEIEGDAILFYRYGETPDLKEIYKQVEKMFCRFHRSISSYDVRRFCQCKACSTSINLTLKIISHYGELAGYTIKSYNKLFGKDVIIAHRLLKNDIEEHEYWLVTKNLRENTPPGFTAWMKWDNKVQLTEGGEILYYYTQLGELKNEIKPEPLPVLNLSLMKKMFSVEEQIDADIIKLFHATGDYRHRGRWMEGVKYVEEITHVLPRVGTKCRCVLNTGDEMLYSTSYSFTPERIQFSETNDDNKSTTYYTLTKVTDEKTHFLIDYYLNSQSASDRADVSQMEQRLKKSVNNLKVLMRDFQTPSDNQ